jgi:site-specific DNA recombinase
MAAVREGHRGAVRAAGAGGLVAWAEESGRRRDGGPVRGGLRFVFYGRVSTEDWQDPVTSRARQREQAEALVRGHGVIVAEFFDAGQSRTVAWGRRPEAAALVALLADPGRGWDVVGEYERAFYGSQYAVMAPLFEHYGVGLWMPEAGGRNPHRTGAGWTLGTVATILANPRYTGRQVWNRQRTDRELADPADVSLGHKSVQRWNLPDGWVISRQRAHPPLVSEVDFIAAQNVSSARGPAPGSSLAAPSLRRYLLAGLLVCGGCGRRMESAWSNSKPAYRCRHGRTTAARPGPGRVKNAYIREDRILPHLPALHLQLTEPAAPQRRRRTRRGLDTRHHVDPEDMIRYLRERQITLTYDPASGALRAGPPKPPRPSA